METRRLGPEGPCVSEIGVCLPDGPARGEVLRRALELGGRLFWSEQPVDADGAVVLPAGGGEAYGAVRYNLLDQVEANARIRELRAAKRGVVATGVLAGGALAGITETSGERVRQLKFLVKEGRTLVQAALQFVLANEQVSCAIVRCSSAGHVEEVFSAPDAAPLTASELEEIFETWSNRFD